MIVAARPGLRRTSQQIERNRIDLDQLERQRLHLIEHDKLTGVEGPIEVQARATFSFATSAQVSHKDQRERLKSEDLTLLIFRALPDPQRRYR